MRLKNKPLQLLLLLFIGLSLAVWLFIKPIHIFAPQLVGVSRVYESIYTDDVSRRDEASALYENAVTFVNTSVAPIRRKPRIIFCATEKCFGSFGLSKPSGHTFGTFGIVIGPRGWKPYYVRHEMIHHLQAEKLGNLWLWRGPKWLIEGMAYSLSEDPRAKLSEPFEGYRSRFEIWYRTIDKKQFWSQAGKL